MFKKIILPIGILFSAIFIYRKLNLLDRITYSIKKININIFSNLGNLVYSDLFDFTGDIFVNPKIETSGIYYIEVNVDGIIIREKLVVY